MAEIELPKTPAEISAEALFRHQVVSIVFALEALGQTRSAAVRTATESVHRTETGELRGVKRRTLYRWLAAYQERGILGLEPAVRHVKATALSEELIGFLRVQKKTDPEASIPEILRRARALDVLAPDEQVHRVTAYRAARRLGLPLTCRIAKSQTDMRRFAYAHRMRMVLVDGKHFRAGPGRLKRVAFFFLDDCTRRVLCVVVGASESTALMLRGLFDVIRHFGLMDVLYFDRGPGFKSDDTHAVCLRVGIQFLHGRAHYPEGHGKIEAFNKTVHHDVLRGLPRPEIDPAFGSLELRIWHYLEHDYNVRPHESLGHKTPRQCWDTDERPLRFPRDEEDLRSRFVLTESRHVSADNIVSVDGVHYEMPLGHACKYVPVQRQLLDGSVWVIHSGKRVRLHPVNLALNAETQRAIIAPATDAAPEPPVTAAAIAFDRDFGPVVPTRDAAGPCRGVPSAVPNKEKP